MMTIAWALCVGSLAAAMLIVAFFPKLPAGYTRPLLLVWLAGAILGALHLMEIV